MTGRREGAPPPALGPGQGIRVEESIVVCRTAPELFRLWIDLTTMGRVFRHIERVDCSGRRSHWVANGPLGTKVEWDAEIIHEEKDHLIGWQSLPGSEVASAGSIHFEPLGDGGSTEVRVVFRYDPPGGKLGAAVASVLGVDPSKTVADDLARFKRQVESGRVPAKDDVQVASEESFPASDPPAWTAR